MVHVLGKYLGHVFRDVVQLKYERGVKMIFISGEIEDQRLKNYSKLLSS